MTPERWQRLQEVLSQALEKDGANRDSFLRQSCGDDEELRREVESLLAFDSGAATSIAGIVGAAAVLQAGDADLAEGERLGVYRVVREIGRGGMGTVYLAERDDDQFQKQVAIKLVTQGMDTEELLRRFRQERQILARLDHPYIARLLDGGSSSDGHPFLVMEYVHGISITSYCDQHRLGTRQRIELFLKVCAAVQSAHQNLVVHRDLKPGNILVDPEGNPKLLDFGIAKLLGREDSEDVTMAMSGVQRLTPNYASPEQVRGGAITTAADVYALGVILYELLAGVRPYHRYNAGEILRAVCEEEPERPSAAWRRAAATGNAGNGPILKSDELDNIILMAMQKEPARRYGSVAEFDADLQRYLDGLPVRARKDTLSYRASKFVRRHRTGVAAAALLVATLVAGVAVSTLEARSAQRRFNDVRRMAHAVLYDVYDAIRDLPGSLTARQLVVTTALQYLDGLAVEAAGDTDLQLELAEAYKRIGDVQGRPFGSSLGQTAQAAASYGKAVQIADELARRHPDFVRANLTRMAARESLGDIAAMRGDTEGSLKLYGEGAEIGEAMALHHPDELPGLRLLADLYGASAKEDHNIPRALVTARKGVTVRERIVAASNNEQDQADLAESHSILSSVLESANRFDEALEEGRKNVRLYEALVAAHPLSAHFRHDLMVVYMDLGDAASANTSAADARPLDVSLALESYRKSAAMADALVAADPADRVIVEERGMALMKYGGAMTADKDFQSALATLRRAVADFRTVAEAEPGNVRVLRRLAVTQRVIGQRLASAGHAAEALPSLLEAFSITDAVIAKNPKDLLALNYSWRTSQELASLFARQQQRSEALYYSRKAIGAAAAARGADGANPVTQSFLPRAWSNAALVYATLAASDGAGSKERREDRRQACDAYQKSVDAWQQIPIQSAGTNTWAAQLAQARAEVKRCATAALGAGR